MSTQLYSRNRARLEFVEHAIWTVIHFAGFAVCVTIAIVGDELLVKLTFGVGALFFLWLFKDAVEQVRSWWAFLKKGK